MPKQMWLLEGEISQVCMCTYICRNTYNYGHTHTYIFKSNAEVAKLIHNIAEAGSSGITLKNGTACSEFVALIWDILGSPTVVSVHPLPTSLLPSDPGQQPEASQTSSACNTTSRNASHAPLPAH